MLLLFCIPIGGGIPFGVVIARDAGLAPPVTAALYLVSDVVLAFLIEPVLVLLRWQSQRVPALKRLGEAFERMTGTAGLNADGAQGPLGLIMLAFAIDPVAGRAAAAAAGHGPVRGWFYAITGDMLYFGVLMATTLWLSSVLGNDRVTIGAVIIGTWVLGLIVTRMRRRGARSSTAQAPASSERLRPVEARPRRVLHSGRRRSSSRGMHR